MGKVDVFIVQFHGNKKTFYPGEVLNGTVILRIRKEIKLRRITLEFHGEASIHWKDTRQRSDDDEFEGRETVHYRNSETYIATAATLFGKAPSQGGDNPVLAAGEHVYPFQFQIPNHNLPTSVETTHGNVRYWLNGIIDRPWRFNVTTKAVFTIIEYVDINTHLLLQPCETEMNRNVCSLCCTSGLLTVTMQSDRGGYCPGESIAVSATINNGTNSAIICLEVQLVQHTAYYSSEGTSKLIEQLVARVKAMEEGVRSGDEGRVDRVALLVPSLPPTMNSCSCMKIYYSLRLKVRVRGATDSYVNIPITIGSIPYRPPLPQFAPMAPTAPPLEAVDQVAAFPPPSAQYGYSAQSQYPPAGPPSYAECVYGGASIHNEGDSGDMMGDKSFTPMYPFVSNYQFPS